MPEFFKTIAEFITANLVWVIVIAAALVVLIVLLVVLIVWLKKAKRRRAQAEVTDNESEITNIGETADAVQTTSDDDLIFNASIVEEDTVDPIFDGIPIVQRSARTPRQSEQARTTPVPEALGGAAVNDTPPVAKAESAPTVASQTDLAAKPRVAKGKRLTGKWIIEHKGAGEYSSKLCASNGEVMLTSEIYTSEDGARAGIGTIIKAVQTGEFVIYREKSGNYYYKLKSANNRLLCVGEIYKTKDQCERATESVKRIASDAPVGYEVAEGAKYINYTPAVLTDMEIRRSARGKWRIEPSEDGRFSAKLYANNGQLMLATEEVSSLKRASEGVESVKKNAALGNFIIDRDKFGRYYYKLRNTQKSVICIGEAYDKLDSCVSAIESVRRFAATSE